jgi:hypothetical protein
MYSCTFSFFKYYQFQPRLQIVNKTLASAMIHIFHFMVLFSIIHLTFSMIGYLNFGPQNRDFSTLMNAMQVFTVFCLCISGLHDVERLGRCMTRHKTSHAHASSVPSLNKDIQQLYLRPIFLFYDFVLPPFR